MKAPPIFDAWRHRFTVLLAAATVGLLAAGGLVTSTGSGLSVPDWPLSFGRLFPPMVGGVLFEHGHRLIAGAVGLLTIVLAFWYGCREPRPRVRLLAYAALGAVVVQGLLGGLTVLLRLPPVVSVAHACLAQAFFVLVVSLGVLTSRRWVEAAQGAAGADPRPSAAGPAAVAAGAVYAQIVLGAVMRHTGAGLAIPDFPLAFGRLVPPLVDPGIVVHFAHRVMALVVLGLAIAVAARTARRPERLDLVLPARMAVVLVIIQILLGAGAVLTRLAVIPTTLHLVNGALLLATFLVIALRAGRDRARSRPAPAPGRAQEITA